jgi:hypothetical protein
MDHVSIGYVADALEGNVNTICGVNVAVGESDPVRWAGGESGPVRWAGSLSDPMSGCGSTIHI